MARSKQGKQVANKATASKTTVKKATVSKAKRQYDASELEWVVTTVAGYLSDGFHGHSQPEREVSTLRDVSPADREQAIEKLKEKIGKAFAGWQWDEIERRAEVVVQADEPGRYELKCTYDDGGEYVSGILERRPAKASTTTPSRTALATASGAVIKSTKNTQKISSNNTASKVEFVWVLTLEMGYVPDGFHSAEEPGSRKIVTTIPDGPDGREKAIERLEEEAGELWGGDGWEALQEIAEVDYEDDTDDRYSVMISPPDDGEYCRVVVERRESTDVLLNSSKPHTHRGYTGYSYGGYDCVEPY